MSFNILSTAQAVQSYLMASGRFKHVQIGEPKSALSEGYTAAIFNESARVVETTLSNTIELHTLTVRVYRNMLDEPEEAIETETSLFISELMDSLIADYDLGGSVRNIDIVGQYGSTLGFDYAYCEVGHVMFRLADITLPLIVDGSTAFAA